MEGYSVTEAASVLGVPTERVWELLARGVLSGAAEGETGMRVYLQPRPAPAPPEPRRANGDRDRDEPERELSPFRELLSEFRGLTERYGQALLALGEARGEVATLRSRVDLLEARMDLRLTGSPPSAPASWASTPIPPGPPAADEATTTPEEHDDENEHGDEDEPRSRARGPRRATESFAEALARAEDPSPPELPGAAEAAAAFAALHRDSESAFDLGGIEISLPREMPAAEPVPVAQEAEPAAESAAERVPVAQAAELADEPVAADADASVAPSALGPDAEAVSEAPADEPGPGEADADAAEDDGRERAAEPGPLDATEQPLAVDEPVAAERLEWDAERYTTAIEEPDWLAAEVLEPERPAAVEPDDAKPSVADEQPAASAPLAPGEEAVEDAGVDEGPFTGSVEWDEEEADRWFRRARVEDASGASEMEVATTGHGPDAGDATSLGGLPGAAELGEATAALDALAGRSSEGRESGAAAETGEDAIPPEPDPAPAAEPETWPSWSGPSSEPAGPPRSETPRSEMPPSGSVTTPTSRAYRRLRRIFPS